jgi:hypothetical protein
VPVLRQVAEGAVDVVAVERKIEFLVIAFAALVE